MELPELGREEAKRVPKLPMWRKWDFRWETRNIWVPKGLCWNGNGTRETESWRDHVV